MGRTGCNCRFQRETMDVCADSWPEQWQDDMEPDRETHSSRIFVAVSHSNNAAKKPLLLPFPLLTSFMCRDTSGTHKSKVSSQTLITTLSTRVKRTNSTEECGQNKSSQERVSTFQ